MLALASCEAPPYVVIGALRAPVLMHAVSMHLNQLDA